MQEYKSSEKRLAKWFAESRDNWKEKALSRQKELRALEIKIRDLENSRENWKERAKKAEKELQKKEESTSESPKSLPVNEIRAKGHYYPVNIIKLSIEKVIRVCNSLRGVEKDWQLVSTEGEATPSHSSIRAWLARVGLFELKREKEKREDWLFIVDLSIELGQQKCLVILGVSQEYYLEEVRKNGRGLTHQEVEVLELEIMTSTKGELIAAVLEKVAIQVGTPLQIVSDHGSDLYRGIQLYQEKNPEVVHSYDVTHQMALLLKEELEKDEKYQSFIKRCHQCRQEIQQTELLFLMSPRQRTKARYFNLDTLINWANQVLIYEMKQDFSLINTNHQIDREALVDLAFMLDGEKLKSLSSLPVKNYSSREELDSALCQYYGETMSKEEKEIILQVTDKGRRQFEEKLGWLKGYQDSLPLWTNILAMTRSLESQIKQQGLSQTSLSEWEGLFPQASIPENLMPLAQKIRNYLHLQVSAIPEGEIFLGTSDVIESIFGKYKLFSQRSPIKEMGLMVLTIVLETTNLTVDLIKQALETVRSKDVKMWQEEVFGQSSLSKRKAVFSSGQLLTEKVHELSSLIFL